MKTVIDKADTRGYFNHGWLKTYHTFSFADYHNPRRIHFGALRVLNDDTVAPGEGFGMHPPQEHGSGFHPFAGLFETWRQCAERKYHHPGRNPSDEYRNRNLSQRI